MATAARMHPLFGLKQRKMRQDFAQEAMSEAEVATMGDAVKAPLGQRFDFWLGTTVKRYREDAGLELEDVSSMLKARGIRIGKEALDRFEKGRTRPRNEPRLLAGIAKVVGLAEPRDFYADAVRAWYEHGEAPADGDEPA